MCVALVAGIVDGAFTVVAEVDADGLALPAGASTLILTLPLLITNIFATSLVAYQAWYVHLCSGGLGAPTEFLFIRSGYIVSK